MENILAQIAQMCDGIEYPSTIPHEAKKLAHDNNCIIIVGSSDDLMKCYGVDCELTEHCGLTLGGEHECYDGTDFSYMQDPSNYGCEGCPDELYAEIKEVGLKVWWCGKSENEKLENYTDEMGAFTYTVNDGIKSVDFKVMEDNEVYCIGKVVQLKD